MHHLPLQERFQALEGRQTQSRAEVAVDEPRVDSVASPGSPKSPSTIATGVQWYQCICLALEVKNRYHTCSRTHASQLRQQRGDRLAGAF